MSTLSPFDVMGANAWRTKPETAFHDCPPYLGNQRQEWQRGKNHAYSDQDGYPMARHQ
ncbi:hypothetical protein ACT6QG_14965 [Xanthobacter sp. TB0136]|uniref:hypothetical protein n=1 Tax=Xanthobacter sp. TB0136 TaxID=3459177 RepID=UPI00403A0232